MADPKHNRPVPNGPWDRRERIYPNLVFPIGNNASFFYAPCTGYIEKIVNKDFFIFRHKDEPNYSIFTSDNLKITDGLAVNQELSLGEQLGSFEGSLSWRVGVVGNTKDWLDPEKWVVGDFQVWVQAKQPKKETDWGTLLTWAGIGYYLLKGNSK